MPGNGQSLKDGMDSLAQVLQATDRKLGSDYFILSGPQCENGSRINSIIMKAFSCLSMNAFVGNLVPLQPNSH